MGGGILFLLLAVGLFSRVRFVRKAKNRIEKEKDRSENFQYEVSEKYDSYINAQYIYNMYYKELQNKPIFIATQGPIKRSFGLQPALPEKRTGGPESLCPDSPPIAGSLRTDRP